MSSKMKWRTLAALGLVLVVVAGVVFTNHSSPRASAAFCSTMRQILGPDGTALAATVTPPSGNSAPTPAQHQLAERLEVDLRRAQKEGPPTALVRWISDYQIRLKLSPDQTQLLNSVERFRAFSASPLKNACPQLNTR
ncbi:MAG: hypothetical protein KGJ10_07055 [Acidobacteriota bacterium]|nr:hypothetical protein [Acidobacteriota bacterium]MDE3044568.1 hypothetical protein [Acidobacteriota bacterium]MDE3107840.1 hypothetical protein [Acidobacteriota bacterium]MDE3223575.1 hypothetical protein [Acidobacteriota bacterium]